MSKATKDCRADFSETAALYRKGNIYLEAIGAVLGMLFIFVVIRFPTAWLAAAAILLCIIGLAVWSRRTLPKLVCQSCDLDTDTDFVRFCHECGSNEIQEKGEGKYFLAWPRCLGCGKELGRGGKGNRRFYKIRFCTRCGAYLDEQGL